MKTSHAAVVCAICGLASAANAQTGSGGTVNSVNATFVQGDNPTTNNGTLPFANLTVGAQPGGTGNPDHVYQALWAVRPVGSATAVFPGPATSGSWAGDTGTVVLDIAGSGRLTETYKVTGQGTTTGRGKCEMTLRWENTTGVAIQARAFHYIDIDLFAGAGGDSATLVDEHNIRIEDTTWQATYRALESTAWQVTAFAVLRGQITGNTLTALNNSGLPFTGDFTGGYQFDATIQPGAFKEWKVTVYIGEPDAGGGCVADVDDGSGTGHPDGGVTIDDLLYYILIFTDGNIAADVDNGTGTGTHDGGVTIDDLLYYVFRFENGC